MLSRRQFLTSLTSLAGLAAAGCASDGSTPELVAQTVTQKPRHKSGYPLTVEQIDQIPYATLGVSVGGAPGAVMVLSTISGTELRWVSADRVIFITDHGRLLRTQGLKRDLLGTHWLDSAGGDPLVQILKGGSLPPPGIYRSIDLAHENEQNVQVESRFEDGGTETIRILGREHATRRIDEIADMPVWRWRTKNRFWIDLEQGRVWRSVQQFCPEIPPLTLETLKPASL
jgi:hypothetical protein